MKIIITGISGFVGKNLSEFLINEGHEVIPLSLRHNNWELNNDADTIIHLAGIAHDTKKTLNENIYYEINFELTKNLYNSFINSKIKNFIFFSSVKAVVDNVELPLNEELTPNPQTVYGKSKLLAEQYILSKDLPSDKKFFIIRPSMIHGKGNKGNLNILYKIIKKGIPWPLGLYDNKRSFLSIDNLNFLISKMLEKSDMNSGIYNFTDDTPLSTNEIIKLISKSDSKSVCILKIPKSIIYSIALVGDFLKLPLNSERLQKLTENFEVSNYKIRNELGIEKLPNSSIDGILKTINYFKKQNHI